MFLLAWDWIYYSVIASISAAITRSSATDYSHIWWVNVWWKSTLFLGRWWMLGADEGPSHPRLWGAETISVPAARESALEWEAEQTGEESLNVLRAARGCGKLFRMFCRNVLPPMRAPLQEDTSINFGQALESRPELNSSGGRVKPPHILLPFHQNVLQAQTFRCVFPSTTDVQTCGISSWRWAVASPVRCLSTAAH